MISSGAPAVIELKEAKEMEAIDSGAMESRAHSFLSDAGTLISVESKYDARQSLQRLPTQQMESVLLYELPDRNQKVSPKLNYDEDEQAILDGWEYHPKLGDLEKREITITDTNEFGQIVGRRKEVLWFAKDSLDSKRKVFIAMKVKRVSAIDNKKETFRMKFHLYMNWIVTEREYREYIRTTRASTAQSPTYYDPVWKPDLEFMNAVEIHTMERREYPGFGKYKLETLKDFYIEKAFQQCRDWEFDPQKCRFIRTKLECDMTFAEELELQSFPFDCQDLSCIIKGNFLNKHHYVFLPELRQPQFASIDSRFSVIDEWDLATALIEFANDQSSRTRTVSYPTIVLRLKLKRKWSNYVVNIILLLFILCGCSLSAFYLDFDQLGERLGLILTLLLTSVAFSIVIGDKLPNVAYLTFIDKYILASYIFLISVLVESMVVSDIDDDDDNSIFRQETDFNLFYVFSCLWIVLMGIVFTVYAWYLRRTEEMKLLYSSDDIEDVVNVSRQTLTFDYRNVARTGHNDRILSFMAGVKKGGHNRNTLHFQADSAKHEELRQRHKEFLDGQHKKRMKLEGQSSVSGYVDTQ